MKVSRTDALLGLRLGLVVAAVLLASPAVGLSGEIPEERAAFDPPEDRPASDVVPPELLRGPHYQLGPTVRTFTFMNQYSGTSDYGSFHPRATHGCAGWCGRSPRSRGCRKSIRATRLPRRPNPREDQTLLFPLESLRTGQ